MAAVEGVANVDAAVDVIDLCDDDGAEKGAKIVSNSVARRGGLTIEIADEDVDDSKMPIPQRSNTRKQRKSAPKTSVSATKTLSLESTGKAQAPEAASDNDTAILTPLFTRKRKSAHKKSMATATALPLESSGDALDADTSTPNEVTPKKRQRRAVASTPRTKAPANFSYDINAPFTWTDDEIYFEIEGKPVTKRGVCQNKSTGKFYAATGRLKHEFAAVVTQLLQEQVKAQALVLPKFAKGTPLKARMQFFFPLATDATSKTRTSNIYTCGDCDNLSKFVLDALRKIAFADDCYVVELNIAKSFDPSTTKGRTAVSICKCP